MKPLHIRQLEFLQGGNQTHTPMTETKTEEEKQEKPKNMRRDPIPAVPICGDGKGRIDVLPEGPNGPPPPGRPDRNVI